MSSVQHVLLRRLHRILQQLQDLRERLEAGPRQMKLRRQAVAHYEQELQKLKDESKTLRMTVDRKELSLKTSEAKIANLESKLGAIKTNREYQALKDQIDADKMACSVLTDEILEALELSEQGKAKIPAAEQCLVQAKNEFAVAQEKINESHRKLETEVARLEGQLKEAESELPTDFKEAYSRIVGKLGADGLAAAENETCMGCHHRLTANMTVDLGTGRMLRCKVCSRILYLPEAKVFGPGGGR